MAGAHAIELAEVGVYMIALVFMGLRFTRRQTSTDIYFVAKRSVPGWAMGLSMFATIITAVTVVAYPGAAYAGNWHLLVPGFMVIGVLALVGFIIIPFFRRVVGMSAYEYFGKRFGPGIRLYASFTFAVGHFSKMAVVQYLLALTIGSMMGWKMLPIIAIEGTVTIVYTLLGGIEAVVWTDVLQSGVLWLGLLVTLGFLLFMPSGHPHELFALAVRQHKFSLGTTAWTLTKPGILVLSLYGFFFYLQKYTADQTLVQRYLIARSDSQALRGVALGALLCMPVWALFMLLGTLLWSYYHLSPTKFPAYIHRPAQIFPYFLSTHFPPVLVGLILASLVGAAMASMASDLNCISVVGVEDFYRRIRPRADDHEFLRAARVLVAIFGVLTMSFAVMLIHSRGTVLSLYYAITGIVAGGLAGLFLLAFLSRRAHRCGVWTGIVVSVLFTIWATLTGHDGEFLNLGRWNYTWHTYLIGVVGNILLLVFGYLASWIWQAHEAERRELTMWEWLDQMKLDPGISKESRAG
jgi:solute:Na+ symporter, SSS family